MDLPAGYAARPFTTADATAVYELFAASEKHDTGEVAVEPEDILGDWARPSFDLTQESVGIWAGGVLAAGGEVWRGRRAEATVHPDHRGRGLGSWLAGWVEDTARRRGGTLVGQSVPVDGTAEELFRARGYRVGWTSWVLVLPDGAAIDPQPLPEGYSLRTFVPGEDDETAYRLIEDAFGEWENRPPVAFDDWASITVRRPGFEPWQIRLVVDASGTAVGTAFTIVADGCGYVDQIAVRRDQRGLGLARALLADAFAGARERGGHRSELATDTRTGALGLYEKVGMQIHKTYRHWMTDL